MARITVEDCLTQQTNRFGLVLLAAKRAKQLLGGAKQAIADNRGNKSIVTALREIADGQVRFMSDEEVLAQKEQQEQTRAEERSTSTGSSLPAGLRLGARFAGGSDDDVVPPRDAGDTEEEAPSQNGTTATTL
jgi:DNA-directed RNA polymerase subunit omega